MSSKSIAEIVAELRSPDYHVQYRAIDALGKLDGPQAMELLIQALGNYDVRDDESRVNRHAMNALIKIGKPAVPLLIEALDQKDTQNPKDGWKRYWVAETLGWIGEAEALESLMEALEDENRGVCEGAAEALGRLGNTLAVTPLERKLATVKHTDGYIYTAVTTALKVLLDKARRGKR